LPAVKAPTEVAAAAVPACPTVSATPDARPVAVNEFEPPTVIVAKPVVLPKFCAALSLVDVATNIDSKPETTGIAAPEPVPANVTRSESLDPEPPRTVSAVAKMALGSAIKDTVPEIADASNDLKAAPDPTAPAVTVRELSELPPVNTMFVATASLKPATLVTVVATELGMTILKFSTAETLATLTVASVTLVEYVPTVRFRVSVPVPPATEYAIAVGKVGEVGAVAFM